MIDPARAVGATFPPVRTSWDARDVLLYHLSVGAAMSDPVDPRQLRWAYEQDLEVLPSFAAVPLYRAVGDLNALPGVEIDLTKVLHGEQYLEVHRPLPPSAEVECTARLVDVYDKQKAAVLVVETTISGPDGQPLVTSRSLAFARGEGGFGGHGGPPPPAHAPSRPPDAQLRTPTAPNQALLFRLNGDLNPLHADPSVAALAGFPRPILHGLSSYGAVLRTVVEAELDGRASVVTGYSARFAGVVFPGDTLVTDLWREPGHLAITTSTLERGEPVLTHASVRFHP
jgi:acyl dehydratase